MDNTAIMQGIQKGMQPPQAAPQQPIMAPQPDKAQPPATQDANPGAEYDPTIAKGIEEHLNQINDKQKAFLVNFLTPELALLFGIVLGKEGFDYFNQYADPKKQLTVIPRQPQQAPQAAPPGQQPNSAPQMPPQQAPMPQKPANVSPQPPARSIMGM